MAEGQSTEEFAKKLLVKPNSVRRALCVNGHYCGIKPIKLANRRLLWPAVDAVQMEGGQKNA